MDEPIERLRSYLPLGDGSLWSQSSKDYAIAADMLEAQAKEIAELNYVRQLDVDEFNELKAVCDQMGEALEAMAGYGNLFRTSSNQISPYHKAVEALAAWREMK